MEKKQYEAPVSEFVEFEMGDIVATYGESLPTQDKGMFLID